MNLAQMATEIELDSFHTAPRTINALRCNLIGMIHLAPLLRNLDAHFVVVFNRGDASLTGLAINATTSNHLIHVSYFIIYFSANRFNAASSNRCTVHSSIGIAPMLRYTFRAGSFQSRHIHSIRPQ